MIEQGTDGLSRGDFTQGVMRGTNMLHFVPLNRDAIARQPSLLTWIKSWAPTEHFYHLGIDDWFDLGQGITAGLLDIHGMWCPGEFTHGCFLWSPPPALADIAVEALEESRHKRKHLSHVVVIPRLMTYSWRKRLTKICDLVLEIVPGWRAWWPSAEHEPILIGLTLPFSSSSPWQVRHHPAFLDMERELRSILQDEDGHEGRLLRQLFHSP